MVCLLFLLLKASQPVSQLNNQLTNDDRFCCRCCCCSTVSYNVSRWNNRKDKLKEDTCRLRESHMRDQIIAKTAPRLHTKGLIDYD